MSDADLAQKQASDPDISVWVSAHAGSGKTTVLAQRVIRLLLRGTAPGAILCLTYTRAASAQMANKIYATLATWVKLSDAELTKEIEKIDRPPKSPALLEKARRLFAESLETPGGLKVQTIHAFAAGILRKFSLEAGIPADFTELDPINFNRLKNEAVQQTLALPSLKSVFLHLSTLGGDMLLEDLFETIIQRRKIILNFYQDCGQSLDRVYATLCEKLKTAKTSEQIDHEIIADSPFEARDIKDWIHHLSAFSGKTEKEIVKTWTYFLKTGDKNAYMQVFFTKNFVKIKETLITKPVQVKYPAFDELMRDEADRLQTLLETKKAIKSRDTTFAILQLGVTLITLFEKKKRAGSYLDFDDLIDHAGRLLTSGATAWVNYKLDQGIDHILVDEAQDTSPDQWEIIKALAEEFTGGTSARLNKRTLFVVGDEKQSIYSFQGADPAKFDEMRQNFAEKFHQSQQVFEKIPLKTSFRSSPVILSFVDEITKNPDVSAGLLTSGALEPHMAFHDTLPGLIELWPLELKPEKSDEEWSAPVDQTQDNVTKLADKIARSIKTMLDQRHILPHKNRPIEARDILILMKKRGSLFQAVNNALKAMQIPSAGTDRLVLRQHLAVQDLLVLGESLLNLHDDFSLATLLRTPLFDVNEQQLFDFCNTREGHLFDALPKALQDHLIQWQILAQTLLPFGFYAKILMTLGGRARFITRFGREVEDILDSFMSRLEAFETSNLPDLRLFISTMRESDDSLKRDPDVSRDEVRVMTVHGSKGLEAPIVYLCDVTTDQKGGGHKRFFHIKDQKQSYPLWSSKIADDPAVLQGVRQSESEAEYQEYQRLLYVGLTRAEQRLILCGVQKISGKNWHNALSPLMEQLKSDEIKDPFGEGLIQRFFHRTPVLHSADISSVKDRIHIPNFTMTAVEKKTTLPFSEAKKLSDAEKLGIKIHKLMQILPDIPLERHEETIFQLLGHLDVDIKKLSHMPEMQQLWTYNALTEVPIAGKWQGQSIERRIDRLCLVDDRVIILDYKTGQQSAINDRIIDQMRCYASLIMPAFKDKKIEAKVIFIKTGMIKNVSLTNE